MNLRDRVPSDMRAWAKAYREGTCPSPERRAAILAALLEPTVPADPGTAAANSRPPRWSWTSAYAIKVTAVAAAAAALAAAAVLLLARSHPTTDSTRAPHEAAEDLLQHDAKPAQAVPRVEPRPVRAAKPEPAVQIPQGSDEPTSTQGTDASEPPPPRTQLASSPDRRRMRRERPPKLEPELVPEPEPEQTALRDDLECLRRLRAAERTLSSDPAGALALVEAHARDFPESSVDLERESLWLRASCRNGGDAAIIEKRRHAFARRQGSAAYRVAISQACD